MFVGMPKIAKELSAVEVKRITQPGWKAVGGVAGLLLQVKPPSREGLPFSRSWILRLRIAGVRQPIGLGSYPQVTLAEAREQARKLSLEAKSGVNLLASKRAKRSALIAAASKNKTFQECADSYMEAHATDYTNDKHRKQWASTLQTYAYPYLGRLLVADITMRHILDVMKQETTKADGKTGAFWLIKTETAKRLLDRIKTILDFATVNEYRSGTNPSTWKGYLDTQLPSPRGIHKVKHHPALPYTQTGAFIAKLKKHEGFSARALEFLILTAVRSGSVRMADWEEIDFESAVWIIPAAHTKKRREHRVPLPPQAIELLIQLPKISGVNLIFPSPTGKALSDMAINQLMRGMRGNNEFSGEAVPHGFRSTFRDWAAEQTSYPDEIRKSASSHIVGDETKSAYQRTDLLEKRRQLMLDWATYLNSTNINCGSSSDEAKGP